MAKEDYYKTLGVNRNVSAQELKAAYRRLAMKYHPDRNPSPEAEEQFKKINEAYEVLSDPQKKQIYDNYGADAVNNGAGFGGFQSGGFGGFEDIFSSVFSDMFGGSFGGGFSGTKRRRARRGNDLQQKINVTLEEAYTGVEEEINYTRIDTCDVCHGTGAEEGTSTKTCPTCKGSGVVQFSQGFFSMRQACPDCGGQGTILEHPCKACKGSGRTKKKNTLKVKLPAGIKEGSVLRVANGGDIGTNDGGYGDLYLQVSVKPHKVFERDGDDLILNTEISYPQAVLGGEIKVQNLMKEDLTVEIPKGSTDGSVISLNEQGMPVLERANKKGAMRVVLNIKVPKKVTPRQKELLEELAKTFNEEIKPTKKGLFDKLFGWFL